MTDVKTALSAALRKTGGQLNGSYDSIAAAILATEPMQEWLRDLAKDIGATAYAEGLHDAHLDPEQERLAALGARLRDDSEGTIYGTIWDWLGEQRRSIYMMRDIENMTKGVILYRAAIDAALEAK